MFNSFRLNTNEIVGCVVFAGPAGPEVELATRLLEAIKNKESMDNLKAVLDSLSDVGTDHQSKCDHPPTHPPTHSHTALSQTKMAVLTQCVLKVGCKTITHCFLALVK